MGCAVSETHHEIPDGGMRQRARRLMAAAAAMSREPRSISAKNTPPAQKVLRVTQTDDAEQRRRRYSDGIADVRRQDIARRHERDIQVVPDGAGQVFSGRSISERGALLRGRNADVIAAAGFRSQSFQHGGLSLTVQARTTLSSDVRAEMMMLFSARTFARSNADDTVIVSKTAAVDRRKYFVEM
jgi:hypothetical protein